MPRVSTTSRRVDQRQRAALARAWMMLVAAQAGPLAVSATSATGRRDLCLIALPMLIAFGLLWRRLGDASRDQPPAHVMSMALVFLLGVGWVVIAPKWLVGAGWALTLAAATWIVFGRKVVRALILPCLGLAMVGLADQLTQWGVLPARRIAATTSATMVNIWDDEVGIQGTWLCWPGGRVEVTADCAGAHSWLAGLVWAWFLICIGRLRFGRAVGLLAIAGLLLAGANILRIVVLLELVRRWGPSVLDGFWHPGIGLVTYAAAFCLVILLWWGWQAPPKVHAASDG